MNESDKTSVIFGQFGAFLTGFEPLERQQELFLQTTALQIHKTYQIQLPTKLQKNQRYPGVAQNIPDSCKDNLNNCSFCSIRGKQC